MLNVLFMPAQGLGAAGSGMLEKAGDSLPVTRSTLRKLEKDRDEARKANAEKAFLHK
jgi:hypothetical protein